MDHTGTVERASAPGPSPATPAGPSTSGEWLQTSRVGALDESIRSDLSGRRHTQALEQRADEARAHAERLERRVTALERALKTRAPIDQAKGMLMVTFRVDADHAFAMLVDASQRSNIKLALLAQWFVDAAHGIELASEPRELLGQLLTVLTRSDAS